MQAYSFLTVVSLAALAGGLPSFAAEGVQRSNSQFINEPLPKELSQLVSPAEIRGHNILGCLETLHRSKGVTISIDQAGLEKLCKEKLREIQVNQVNFPLPLAAAVEYLAIQVHGSLRIRGKSFHIVAGEGDVLRFLSAPNNAVRAELKKPLTIKNGAQGIPGCDYIEFFSEKQEVPILVAPESFDRELKDSFRKRNCVFRPATREFGSWLDEVAIQMRGRVIIRQEAIVIVPDTGRAN